MQPVTMCVCVIKMFAKWSDSGYDSSCLVGTLIHTAIGVRYSGTHTLHIHVLQDTQYVSMLCAVNTADLCQG